MEQMIQENNNDFWGMTEQNFVVLRHLSQFSYFVIPGIGMVLPIVMWATCKHKSPLIDAHGKNILNWMLSVLVYCAISFVMVFTIIFAFPVMFFLFALMLLGIIFPILGAVKAANKEFYKYPLSICFLK